MLQRTSIFDSIRTMPRYFWVLLYVFTITGGIVSLDHFRVYSSSATVMVIQKNQNALGSGDLLMETVAQLPTTLAFYDRLLLQFPEIKDPWSGMSAADREALWREHMASVRVDGSGLIRLQVTADTAADADFLTEKSTLNLFGMIGQYYDIRTEIDIRTIETSPAHAFIARPLGWFLMSISIGFVLAFTVSSAMARLFRSSSSVRIRRSAQESTPSLQPVTFPLTQVSSEPTPQPTPEVLPEEMVTEKESAAPSSPINNLPFLEEGISLEEHLFGFAAAHPETNETKSDEPAVSYLEPIEEPLLEKKSEPTPEELKRRLNQLLKGDL